MAKSYKNKEDREEDRESAKYWIGLLEEANTAVVAYNEITSLDQQIIDQNRICSRVKKASDVMQIATNFSKSLCDDEISSQLQQTIDRFKDTMKPLGKF